MFWRRKRSWIEETPVKFTDAAMMMVRVFQALVAACDRVKVFMDDRVYDWKKERFADIGLSRVVHDVVLADRIVRLINTWVSVYPEWVCEHLTPEIVHFNWNRPIRTVKVTDPRELTGSSTPTGHEIYAKIREAKLLHENILTTSNLHSLNRIQDIVKKEVPISRVPGCGSTLCAWGDVVRSENNNLYVPFIECHIDWSIYRVDVYWKCLNDTFENTYIGHHSL